MDETNNKPIKENMFEARILKIEPAGFWLLTVAGEFFVSYERYGSFTRATATQIYNFRADSDGREFHWDDIDVDIDVDALRFPEKYPLIDRADESKADPKK